jgi:hypothetical protein
MRLMIYLSLSTSYFSARDSNDKLMHATQWNLGSLSLHTSCHFSAFANSTFRLSGGRPRKNSAPNTFQLEHIHSYRAFSDNTIGRTYFCAYYLAIAYPTLPTRKEELSL